MLESHMAECDTCFDYLLKSQMTKREGEVDKFFCRNCSSCSTPESALSGPTRTDSIDGVGISRNRTGYNVHKASLSTSTTDVESMLRSPSLSKRSSVDLSRLDVDSHGLRNRSQSNTSFDDLISKIRSSENKRTDKLEDSRSDQKNFDPSGSPKLRRRSSDRSSFGSQLTEQITNLSLSRRGSIVQETETISGRSSPQYSRPSATPEAFASEQSAPMNHFTPRLRPQLSGSGDTRKRQSAPLGWRIPSTKYEVDEEDTAVGSEAYSVLERSGVSSAQAPVQKSRSNGNIPGLFAQNPGRPINKKFGGSRQCPGCAGSVFPMEETAGPKGSAWHKACLKCNKCAKKLDSSARCTESEPGGKMLLFCRTCWDKRAQ